MTLIAPNFLLDNPTFKRMAALARAARLETYLAGGAVRDALLGRAPADWDFFVAGGTVADAKALFDRYSASLKSDPNPECALGRWIDIVPSDDMVERLAQGDVSANMVAVNCKSGEILDPFGGVADIEACRLRIVFPSSFVLFAKSFYRHFRFAGQFGFSLDPGAADLIQQHYSSLLLDDRPNRSRLVSEFLCYLSCPKLENWELFASLGLIEGALPLTSLNLESTERKMVLAAVSQLGTTIESLPVDLKNWLLQRRSTVTVNEFGKFFTNFNPLSELRLAALLKGFAERLIVRSSGVQFAPNNLEPIEKQWLGRYVSTIDADPVIKAAVIAAADIAASARALENIMAEPSREVDPEQPRLTRLAGAIVLTAFADLRHDYPGRVKLEQILAAAQSPD